MTLSNGDFHLFRRATSTCSLDSYPRIKLLGEMSGNIGSVKLESIAIYTKLCLDHRETRDVEASFDKQHHYRRKSVLRCL